MTGARTPAPLPLFATVALGWLCLGVSSAFAVPTAWPDVSVKARISSAFGQKGSKICAAWGDGNDPSLANFKTSHVVGLYDWTVQKPSAADSLGFDFWPMLWGADEDQISAFESTVTAGYGTIILGFNEPNEEGESNLDPFTAAALWQQYIEPKRSLGYKTCSPAISSRPNGLQWMQQFLQACSGCTIDYQCLHWYDVGFSGLQTYLEENHDTFGLPIILTEFADQNFNGGDQPSLSDVIAFMQQALEYFDNTDWILAACPFGILFPTAGVTNNNALQNADGTPTELGTIVINDEY
ncbi:glycosyl hydrolase catalytic core-domain-containing protein [Cubamyces lactineus]|nr:glycosyl hydrolase catalytic core-domain-containing protein [Cubamyces lactineus]